ncbi:MAG: RNA polymerase sigma-54 factor, partial [Rhodothermales bacterium]
MLNLQQKQALQQKLSPQQIQYIKLLQLPTLALEQRIKTEMEINPLLEEGAEEDDLIEAEAGATTEEEEAREEAAEEEEYDWEEYLTSAEDLYGYKARVDHSSEEDDREMPMPARMSVVEHLRDQLSFLDLTERDLIIAEQIIGSIDDDGYLRRPLESIVDDIIFNYGLELEDEDVESVLQQIQQLDPIGIGSRDLRECLLVQLRAMPVDTEGRTVAIRMLERAYKDFTMKHFSAILRKLDVSEEELKEAYELIQHRLNPKPGEGEFTAQQNYIT